MTTIVLADDHQIVRQGLRALLEAEPDFSVTGEASDGLEVAEVVQRLDRMCCCWISRCRDLVALKSSDR